MRTSSKPIQYILCVIISALLVTNISTALVRAEGNVVIRKEQNTYLYQALLQAAPAGTFTDGGEITDIQLAGLKGSLSLYNFKIENIQGLEYATEITSLNLSNNYISNISPIKNLKNLKSLDVSKNAITNIYPLAELYGLEYLDLSHNTLISNAAGLSNLTNLKELYMRENQVKSDKPFSGLINLHTFIAPDSGFTSVSGIAKIDSLVNLDISGIPCKNYLPLKRLKNLNSLSIDSKAKDISFLKNMKNLENLTLNSVRAPKYNVLNSLSGNLKYLDLGSSSFANSSDIANLSKLKFLDISSTKVTSISQLSKMGELEELYIHYNKITNIDVLAHFTKLSFLLMDGNGIYDFNPLSWRKDILIYGQNNYINLVANRPATNRMNASGEMVRLGTQNTRDVQSCIVGKNNTLTVPKGTSFDWISTAKGLVSFQKKANKLNLPSRNISLIWKNAANYDKDKAGTTSFDIELDETRIPNSSNSDLYYKAAVTVDSKKKAQGNAAFKSVTMKYGNSSLFAYKPGVKEYDAYISDSNKPLYLSASLANSTSRIWKAALNGANVEKIGSNAFVINPTGGENDKVVLYSIAQNGTSEQITINLKQKVLSSECKVLKAVSFDSAKISQDTIEASDKLYCSEKPIILQISKGAFWEQYADAECQNYIDNRSISINNNGIATTYIKIIAENGMTSKVYKMNLKMPKKKIAVAKPAKVFSPTTINGGQVYISLNNCKFSKTAVSYKKITILNAPKGVYVSKVKVINNTELIVTIKLKKGIKVKKSLCGVAYKLNGSIMSGGKALNTNNMGLLVK